MTESMNGKQVDEIRVVSLSHKLVLIDNIVNHTSNPTLSAIDLIRQVLKTPIIREPHKRND